MKHITVGNLPYWWDQKTETLYHDKLGTTRVPIAWFDNVRYTEFLQQIAATPEPQAEDKIEGLVCSFCGKATKVDNVYLLEGREDGKNVICDKCENFHHAATPSGQAEDIKGGLPEGVNMIIKNLSDTLDQKWIDELAKEGKHEIIRTYRLQILYSQRLNEENRQLREALEDCFLVLEPMAKWPDKNGTWDEDKCKARFEKAAKAFGYKINPSL